MICNYVVFLELTHPSEARALVDVTADPGSWAEKAVTGEITSRVWLTEGQALRRASLSESDESCGSPSHKKTCIGTKLHLAQ